MGAVRCQGQDHGAVPGRWGNHLKRGIKLKLIKFRQYVQHLSSLASSRRCRVALPCLASLASGTAWFICLYLLGWVVLLPVAASWCWFFLSVLVSPPGRTGPLWGFELCVLWVCDGLGSLGFVCVCGAPWFWASGGLLGACLVSAFVWVYYLSGLVSGCLAVLDLGCLLLVCRG